MGNKQKYWKGLEQLNDDSSFIEAQKGEFQKDIPVDEFLDSNVLDFTNTNRRDFLKFMGFSIAAATLVSCETPVIHSIPYINKPEEINPGIANWYASTYYDGSDFANILVKTREGRPIHIQGNKQFGSTHGAVNARINSSVLSLYDSARLKNAVQNTKESQIDIDWETADKAIIDSLNKVAAEGKKIVLLTNTNISPSTAKAIDKFREVYVAVGADFSNVVYDNISYAAMRQANIHSLGKPIIPNYDFSKARIIVSVSADFLSNWLHPLSFISQYGSRRNPDNDWMSKHYQFESCLSITGANADYRISSFPSEEGLILAQLYNLIAQRSGRQTISVTGEAYLSQLIEIADELWNNKGRSLVVSGANNLEIQELTNAINELLNNYGETILPDEEILLKQGDERLIAPLIDEMKSGKVGALLWR